MKTGADKQFISGQEAHPAGGKPAKAATSTRRKQRPLPATGSLSPDAFFIRGGSRKSNPWRRNPAP